MIEVIILNCRMEHALEVRLLSRNFPGTFCRVYEACRGSYFLAAQALAALPEPRVPLSLALSLLAEPVAIYFFARRHLCSSNCLRLWQLRGSNHLRLCRARKSRCRSHLILQQIQ